MSGSGKTHLALHLARALVPHFSDGTTFVLLADVAAERAELQLYAGLLAQIRCEYERAQMLPALGRVLRGQW